MARITEAPEATLQEEQVARILVGAGADPEEPVIYCNSPPRVDDAGFEHLTDEFAVSWWAYLPKAREILAAVG
jgi:hypothetical protein